MLIPIDDISHELKPDGVPPTKRPVKPRKYARPSPSPQTPDYDQNRMNGYDRGWTPLSSTSAANEDKVRPVSNFGPTQVELMS